MQRSDLYSKLATRSSIVEDHQKQRVVGVGVLTTACVLLSFGFTCAMPFAALATFTAFKLQRRDAILSIGVIWLVNQAVGYGCLNYPRTLDSISWGIALGVATYTALLVAMKTAQQFRENNGLVSVVTAFVAAFAIFKIVLFAASLTIQGSSRAFSLLAFKKVLDINLLTLPVLFLLNQLAFVFWPTTHLAFEEERNRAWYEQESNRAASL
jgi:hypothetical protein